MQPISKEELKNRFTYHPPKSNDAEIYEKIRYEAGFLAMIIIGNTPPSREQSLAITHLEEAVMWANAAQARHGHAE